ncbi:neutral/alkaline non-lysosomal ceramidase N-terminal domain-containing protein [Membranihabitans maritimus]|uniref:neutral/alkaline non-lysosomal ceramidase N-terminal domain-containing protein n=1 Tax=Membranihabitans maritimus TaxID=2904244 RepID=UPI001F413B9C|nr:neutral/alkaline non-lysosomal ceramidase N-terminal domain-containing protein [Membranihabitans maritimus]
MRWNLGILSLLIIFSLGINPTPGSSQIFQSAVVKRNITPDNSQNLLGYGARTSTGVNDSIYHRILVMDDGKSEFFLVSSDICLVSPSEYERVKAMVMKEFGINGNQFWWSVTHTHSAPEVGPPGLPEVFLGNRYEHNFDTAYTNFTVRELLSGLREARRLVQPSEFGVGWGFSQANINRRARDINGHTRLGMNPDGPVDRKIGILKIVEKGSGDPIALLSNYAIHGTVMSGQNLLISGDAPGVVSQYVEEKTGAPLLFINGAAGNIAPIYSVYPSPGAGHLEEFKVLLGDKILQAQEAIVANRNDVHFEFGELIMKTPRKEGLGWPSDLDKFNEQTANGQNTILLPIQFLKINKDIGIWAAPLELFCELSNEIRDRSPFPYTFYFGYTNGWLGYMLTEEEVGYGGYEPTVSPYRPEAGRQLVETVSAYLEGELLSK